MLETSVYVYAAAVSQYSVVNVPCASELALDGHPVPTSAPARKLESLPNAASCITFDGLDLKPSAVSKRSEKLRTPDDRRSGPGTRSSDPAE